MKDDEYDELVRLLGMITLVDTAADLRQRLVRCSENRSLGRGDRRCRSPWHAAQHSAA